MNVTLGELVRATEGRLILGSPHTPCHRVSIDSRTLQAGDTFFAISGPKFDGHKFLKAAAQKRASALVVERLDAQLELDSERNLPILHVKDTLTALQDVARLARTKATQTIFIGLTGSNGKTTTKEMLAKILARMGKTLATRGNLNNQIGLPLMLTESEPDHRYVLLEMGTSKPGDMDLLADLAKSKVALITNVGKDHLEFFKTTEGVLNENKKLFDALPKEGTAIINLDDPLLKACAASLPCHVVTYGMGEDAQVGAKDIVANTWPIKFTLRIGKNLYPVLLPATGAIQVHNALAAAATAHALGIMPKEIVEGLASFKAVPMRMEVRMTPSKTVLVDDAYNANPSSMRASIESFCQSYADRPRWLVLSDMRELGPGAREEHRDLGQWISQFPVERIYLYGRDARFIEEGAKSGSFKGQIERHRKKAKLTDALRQALEKQPNTAILFKASRRMKLEEVSHALSPIPA